MNPTVNPGVQVEFFETTNCAKLLDLGLIQRVQINTKYISLKIQDVVVVLDFRGSTYTENQLIHEMQFCSVLRLTLYVDPQL